MSHLDFDSDKKKIRLFWEGREFFLEKDMNLLEFFETMDDYFLYDSRYLVEQVVGDRKEKGSDFYD